MQYADYAVWQREWLPGEVLEAQLAYWRQQLAGRPPRWSCPRTGRGRRCRRYRGATHCRSRCRAALSEALRGAEPAGGRDALHGAAGGVPGAAGAATRGQDDIVVGTPIAGRTRAEMEGLIGFFVNTLVLRDAAVRRPDLPRAAGAGAGDGLGAYAHQDVPFEQLVEELQPERDLSRTPLFQVMFVLQNAPRVGRWRCPG